MAQQLLLKQQQQGSWKMNKFIKSLALVLALNFCFIGTSLAEVLYYVEGVDKAEVGKYLEGKQISYTFAVFY